MKQTSSLLRDDSDLESGSVPRGHCVLPSP